MLWLNSLDAILELFDNIGFHNRFTSLFVKVTASKNNKMQHKPLTTNSFTKRSKTEDINTSLDYGQIHPIKEMTFFKGPSRTLPEPTKTPWNFPGTTRHLRTYLDPKRTPEHPPHPFGYLRRRKITKKATKQAEKDNETATAVCR